MSDSTRYFTATAWSQMTPAQLWAALQGRMPNIQIVNALGDPVTSDIATELTADCENIVNAYNQGMTELLARTMRTKGVAIALAP